MIILTVINKALWEAESIIFCFIQVLKQLSIIDPPFWAAVVQKNSALTPILPLFKTEITIVLKGMEGLKQNAIL